MGWTERFAKGLQEVERLPHKPLPVPLYQRVYGMILRRIQSGRYAPGSLLSTEDQFSAEFGVSKATVRQALGELVERGLVVRQQGRGTFVRQDAAIRTPHPFVGSLADLIIETHGMTVRDATVEHDVPFPAEVVLALGMTTATGTVIKHHRDIAGDSFAYAVVYLSPRETDVLDAAELVPTGRATLLHQRGLPITGATQSMSAELADVEVADHLGIEFGQPVLFAERLIHSDLGPVEMVHTWYRGDLFKWEAELSFSWTENGLAIAVAEETTTTGG